MKAVLLTMLLVLAQPPGGVEHREPLAAIEAGWADVRFGNGDPDARLPQLDRLLARTDIIGQLAPGRAEPRVWRGILLATKAGIVRGLTGYALIREARNVLEAAERIDPAAVGGTGLMQLGIIYGEVPGPPLAFGDRMKARRYFSRAIAIDPAGLAANLAFADFLVKGGRFTEAEPVLLTALRAPLRPDQQLADQGRRAEATALLRLTRSRLGRPAA